MDSIVNMEPGFQEELGRYKENISIYTCKDGRKGISFYYDGLDGKKKRKSFSGKNLSYSDLEGKRMAFLLELYRQKQEAVASVSTVSPVPTVNSMTVAEAYDSFLSRYKATVEYQTYLGEVSIANKIKGYLGGKEVASISPSDFQELVLYAAGTKQNPASPKTVSNVMISFKRLLKYCRRQRLLTADDVERVTDGIRVPTFINQQRHGKKVREQKFLDYAQLGGILAVLEPKPRYYYVVWILVLTGMRPQEFFALEKGDLDRENHCINVCKALNIQERKNKGDRHYTIGVTKNVSSERKVPATDRVFSMFDMLEKVLVGDGSRGKSYSTGCEAMVYVDSNGNYCDIHSFGTNLVKYTKKHAPSLGYWITLNMPRHCYQTYLDGLEAKDVDVEMAVGHVVGSVKYMNYSGKGYYEDRLVPYIEKMGELIEAARQECKKINK